MPSLALRPEDDGVKPRISRVWYKPRGFFLDLDGGVFPPTDLFRSTKQTKWNYVSLDRFAVEYHNFKICWFPLRLVLYYACGYLGRPSKPGLAYNLFRLISTATLKTRS